MAKIKFDILNRFTGAVQCSVEIECDKDASHGVKLGLAVRRAYLSRADLSGADLSDADLSGANLSGANLSRANLSGANLSDAYLSRADLSGANLSRAYLSDADLSGADLSDAYLSGQWIVQGPTRSDGYPFFLQKLTDDVEPMVKAGCRYYTIAQAREHWAATRGGTPLGAETTIIVDSMIALANARGLLAAAVKEAA